MAKPVITHAITLSRHELGKSPISDRTLYGWNAKCTCGWEYKSNGSKQEARQEGRDHLKGLPKPPPPPPEPPRKSTTVIDPLDLVVTIHEADRERANFVRLVRDVAADLARIADAVEKHGLDADTEQMCGVSSYTLDEVSRGFTALNVQRETLRFVLGMSGMDHVDEKLENHPQVQAAIVQYGRPYVTKKER